MITQVTTSLGSDVVTDHAVRAPVSRASRASRPGWRDPRLWIGIAVVTVSVLAGARLLSTSDQYDAVWVVAADHAAGDTLGPGDLTATRVRFADAADRDRYVSADRPVSEDLRLTRAVGAGELLAAAALGPAGAEEILTVPLSLSAQAVPPGLGPGDRVDVWVTDPDRNGPAVRVLREVSVLAVASGRSELGEGGDRQLVLALDAAAADGLGAALALVSRGDVTVVGLG